MCLVRHPVRTWGLNGTQDTILPSKILRDPHTKLSYTGHRAVRASPSAHSRDTESLANRKGAPCAQVWVRESRTISVVSMAGSQLQVSLAAPEGALFSDLGSHPTSHLHKDEPFSCPP